jgi:Na+-translocating ferredoxin:NAD+ oxidoreductase subunit B
MTGRIPLFAVALVVVLVERFVLDRRYGRTHFSGISGDLPAVLADTGISAAILTAGTALAWPIAALALVPAHAVYCYGAVLIAVYTGLAMAAKPLVARQGNYFMADRQCIRAAVVSSLLGIMVLVPQALAEAGGFPAFWQSVRTAALVAAVFAFIRFLYRGIREHIALAGNVNERGTLVSELLTAGLIALAFDRRPGLLHSGLTPMTGALTQITMTITATAFAAVVAVFVMRKVRRPLYARFDRIRRSLPGHDCGACGFAECVDFAAAAAEGRAAAPACVPGGAGAAHEIADALGLTASIREPVIAVVNCNGGATHAKRSARYEGIRDCRAALLIGNGYQSCQPCIEGCLGLGSCVRACPFGAISMSKDEVAVVDRAQCTGCGACIAACPRGLLSLIPEAHKIYLACSSHGHGDAVIADCSAGCTGCEACVSITPSGAIAMHDHLPCLDYGTPGENFLAAASRCPSRCFIDLVKVRPKANIDTKCDGCGECAAICPVPGAITGRNTMRHVINKELCIGCGRCLAVCHVRAIALWGSLGYTADFKGSR